METVKKVFIILGAVLFLMPCYSQLSIRQENTQVFQKPPVYDSLSSNFQFFNKTEIYKNLQYIGQSFYFKPLTEAAKKKFCFEEFIVDKDTILTGTPILPFEKTDMAIIYKTMKLKANKKDLKSINTQETERKNQYLNSFKFQTNIYKPSFASYTSKGSSGEVYAKIGTNPEALENKSFLIADIFRGHNIKERKPLVVQDNSIDAKLLFMLIDENNDTLYWKTYIRQTSKQTNFIIKSFYEKQLAFYKNQTFVYRREIPFEYVMKGDKKEQNNYEEIITSRKVLQKDGYFTDINNLQKFKAEEFSEWVCTDVTLIPDDWSYQLFYVLKNKKSNEIKIPVGELVSNGFVFKESYNKEKSLRNLKVDELRVLREKEEAERQAYLIARKKALIVKYGEKYGSMIFDGKVTLGMTKAMCADAWGETNSIIKNNLYEVWIYGYRNSLHFNGDKLVQIVNI